MHNQSNAYFESLASTNSPKSRDNCRRAAINNEIVRLIWVGYKEQYLLSDDNVSFVIRHDGGNEVPLCSIDDAQRALYDARLKDDLSIHAIVQDGRLALDSSRSMLELMKPWLLRAFPMIHFTEERWQHWLEVSERAILNETEALLDKLELDIAIAPHGSILGYASGLAPNESFVFFCRYAAYFGRFDMPFSKMRLPVENAEAAVHAPEFGRNVAIRLAAVEQSHLMICGGDCSTLREWLRRDYPEAHLHWMKLLTQLGLNPERFAPMPVHPLSLALYAQCLKGLISDKQVVLETGIEIDTRPGLSYRTMIPLGEDGHLAIKLPIPLQLTGYVRFIDMEELRCAPILSECLSNIVARERGFSGRLRMDREILTAGIVPRNQSAQPSRDTPYMACLLRENQGRSIPLGSVTMPLAALFSSSSLGGAPVLIEAMRKSGVESQEQAIAWFEHYLDMTLESILTMFLRHGVMLEAHQQNLGITLDMTGKVEMLHYHDMACAVFIHRPSFLAAGHSAITLQGMSNPYASDDAKSSCTQFVHTVLLLNLLPVIDIICDEYCMQRSSLLYQTYLRVASILSRERARLASEPSTTRATISRFHQEFETHVLASTTFSAKRLLGRLFAQSQTPSWGQVPNRDPAFAAVRGSSVQIENPLYPFYEADRVDSIEDVDLTSL